MKRLVLFFLAAWACFAQATFHNYSGDMSRYSWSPGHTGYAQSRATCDPPYNVPGRTAGIAIDLWSGCTPPDTNALTAKTFANYASYLGGYWQVVAYADGINLFTGYYGHISQWWVECDLPQIDPYWDPSQSQIFYAYDKDFNCGDDPLYTGN
jgi:hypothetical protein